MIHDNKRYNSENHSTLAQLFLRSFLALNPAVGEEYTFPDKIFIKWKGVTTDIIPYENILNPQAL
jgi:hypothetical protein